MFITRMKDGLKTSRFNAEYYAPTYISDEQLLSKFHMISLDVLRDSKAKITYGILKPDNCGDVFRVAKAEKFDSMFINFDNCEAVSEELFDEYARSEVKESDILIAIGGYVGRPAIVGKIPENCRLNINRHLARLRVDYSKIDPYYLLSYLSCSYGNRQLSREITGSVQAGINLEDLRLIKAPIFHQVTQTYIGNKVRQAELLREWAKSIQCEAKEIFPNFINDIKLHNKKSYKVDAIGCHRLDSEFYHPDYTALENALLKSGCMQFKSVTKQVKDSWNTKSSPTFQYYEIGGLNISSGQMEATIVSTSEAPSRAKTSIQQGDILVSTVRPNRKNVGFVVDAKTDMEMVATSGFSVLRFESLEEAAFYHAWLRTDDATAQLMRWNSGSAYPAIDDDVPLNILVPTFENEFKEYWGKKLLKAQFAFKISNVLTVAAKQVVEALIEGKVTETEIIAAQQALENDDNSKDKTILSKLTDKGYAVKEGKPLFTDLNALYELLEEAQQDKDQD